MIDILATVPFVLLIVLLGLDSSTSTVHSHWLIFLTMFRMLRLLRLISISKVGRAVESTEV